MTRIQYIGTYEGQVDGHPNWQPGEVREVEDGFAATLLMSPAFWTPAPKPAASDDPKPARTKKPVED